MPPTRFGVSNFHLKSLMSYWKDAAVAIYIPLEFGRKLLSNIQQLGRDRRIISISVSFNVTAELAADQRRSGQRRPCVTQPSSRSALARSGSGRHAWVHVPPRSPYQLLSSRRGGWLAVVL